MNCRPGDLAVIVKSFCGQEGRLVVVHYFVPTATFEGGYTLSECWTCKGVGTPLKGETYSGHFYPGFGVLADFQLRPIRDPGDDATDETLAWLPVPHKETESA